MKPFVDIVPKTGLADFSNNTDFSETISCSSVYQFCKLVKEYRIFGYDEFKADDPMRLRFSHVFRMQEETLGLDIKVNLSIRLCTVKACPRGDRKLFEDIRAKIIPMYNDG